MGISSDNDADSSLNVARLANLPGEVIAVAGEKSRTMEEETKSREMQRWSFLTLLSLLTARNEKALEMVKTELVDVETLKELVKRLN